MQRTKFVAMLVLFGVLLNGIAVFGASAPNPTYTQAESNAAAQTQIADLINLFVKKGVKGSTGGPIKWRGFDDGEGFSYDSNMEDNMIALADNAMGMLAFQKVFVTTSISETQTWAQGDIWEEMQSTLLAGGTNKDVQRSAKYYNEYSNHKFASDQFIFLEFLSQDTMITADPEMRTKIVNVYGALNSYRANVTDKNAVAYGAYWTMVQGSTKFTTTLAYPYCPFPADYEYPLTNSSLWAAAGLASFGKMMVGSEEDKTFNYVEPALKEAELAMAFADVATWNNVLGLYKENAYEVRPYLANTQILALLACARLYQATGKTIYLTKADTILSSLMTYFWVSGFGGVVEALDHTTLARNGIMRGYDNALLAYALMQLGVATGSNVKNVKEYILGRASNKYTNMGLDVMTFMNNYMWVKTGGDMAGYVEFLNTTTGQGFSPSTYSTFTNIRLSTTNMLALYCLGETILQSKPWHGYYQDYLIYTGIALGVILFVAILVARRRNEGTKLPKVVKGLLGGED